jgi:hypothetical protein
VNYCHVVMLSRFASFRNALSKAKGLPVNFAKNCFFTQNKETDPQLRVTGQQPFFGTLLGLASEFFKKG